MKLRRSTTKLWMRVAMVASLMGWGPALAEAPPAKAPAKVSAANPKHDVTISLLATNDVHGRLTQLPLFGGYVKNVRAARAADGGGVLLLDAGDIFQGTLESNLTEGASMLRGYRALGYTAAAIGNHEFDFGPVGPECTPASPSDDPLGALRARIAEAAFPVLSSNLRTREGSSCAELLPGLQPSILQTVAGVRLGIVGGLTHEALSATHSANVGGLAVAPLAESVAAEARTLRSRGAQIVVALVHAGSECAHTQDADDTTSCDQKGEAFALARALADAGPPADGAPPLVDVIVAGHTHAYVAHRVSGITIIESGSNNRAFGRVDLTLLGGDASKLVTKIFPPRPLCTDALDKAVCANETYEGVKVERDGNVLAAIRDDVARAKQAAMEPLGVEITSVIERSSAVEAPLSNLVVDLMRRAVPGADAAFNNPGSVRVPLPVGQLTYGKMFEMVPFENRLATIKMRVSDLTRVVQNSLQSDRGLVSLSGVKAAAVCQGDQLKVTLTAADGSALDPTRVLKVVTSDYVTASGDNLLDGVPLAPGAITILPHVPMRESLIAGLRSWPGRRIDGHDKRIYDARKPRLKFTPPRPVKCLTTALMSGETVRGPT
ncbi:MAG TPA: bifunctional UDP-sugar hydrolase/5'-nucleotidase [Polyangiales bacterium]|nr:bifunctional UDP-sugar hydrolase/5'-nucleotidase [Polyangiales bacterium]